MSGTTERERPLASIRSAAERGYYDIGIALRHWREELEKRLQQSEIVVWKSQRRLAESEGYLARVAAILGVEVGSPPDWSLVVRAGEAAAERLRALDVEHRTAQQRLDEAQQAARRRATQVAPLSQIAARLGVTSIDVKELLAAIDRLDPRRSSAQRIGRG